MRTEDFAAGIASGRLERTVFKEKIYTGTAVTLRDVHGYGFVPNPLPPNLDRGELLVQIQDGLLEAERSLSELAGIARDLENPYLLIGPFVQREARLSSAIEDTYASAKQVMLFDLDPNSIEPESRNDTREVSNYVKALHYGHKSPLPLCRRLFLEMHKILLDGVHRDAGVPGEFRTTQNAIGKKDSRFENARFVPTPPNYVPECLDQLERYINGDCRLPRLVRFAITHYQFECIHPFDDGNGRLGRLLVALQLCKQAQLSSPLVYISGFFEQNRSDYYDKLLAVSTRNEWEEWISFFLTAIVTQARDAYNRAKLLLELRAKYQQLVQEKRASAVLPKIIDALFEHPVLTVNLVRKIGCVTAPSAGALISKLEKKGIIVEATGRKRKKVYIAPKIIELVDL